MARTHVGTVTELNSNTMNIVCHHHLHLHHRDLQLFVQASNTHKVIPLAHTLKHTGKHIGEHTVELLVGKYERWCKHILGTQGPVQGSFLFRKYVGYLCDACATENKGTKT